MRKRSLRLLREKMCRFRGWKENTAFQTMFCIKEEKCSMNDGTARR